MRLLTPALGLLLLAGFSGSTLADVYLCSDDSGKVSAQNQACPAKAPEPDQSAAYAALTDEQYNWYFAQVECIDRIYYDGGYEVGDQERMRLINRRVATKKLPVYVDEQFEAFKAKRPRSGDFDMAGYMDAYSACDHDLANNPEPNTGSSVTLLSRLQLDGLHTPGLWMNWAYSRANEGMDLVTTLGQTAYFTSGEGFFHAVDLNSGNAQWRYAAGSEVLETLVGDERIYLLTAEVPHIRVLDRATGKLLTQYQPETPVVNLHLAGDLLLFEESSETAEHLVAVDRNSLAERWRVLLSSYSSDSLHVFNNTALVSDDEYKVSAFDAATGKKRWQRQMGEGGEMRTGGQLYYWDQYENSLLTLAVDSGKTTATYRYKDGESVQLDADTQTLYKVSDEPAQIQAIDVRTSKALWTLKQPEGHAIDSVQAGNGVVIGLDSSTSQVLLFDSKTAALTDTLNVPPLSFSETRDEQRIVLTGTSALLVFPR